MRLFKDKIAVITGAGSGIGKALATELARKGAVLILSDKDGETLAATEQIVRTYGSECKTFIVDVSDESAVYKFADEVIAEYKHIDLLFNNAGFALGKIAFSDVRMDDFKKIVDVNMWGVIHHTRAFLDVLISRPEAAIINISSVLGIIGIADQLPYCTTKFAVRGFTEALRMELMETGVRVYCVHPGGINTNIYKNSVQYVKDEAMDKKIQKMLERTSPEDAAKTILKGVEKGNEKILIGIDAEIIDRLARTMPVAYTAIAKKVYDYTSRS